MPGQVRKSNFFCLEEEAIENNEGSLVKKGCKFLRVLEGARMLKIARVKKVV